MGEAKSYPGDIAKLREMARNGDDGAAWLVRKLEVSEVLGSLELLRNADDQRIWDVAEALVTKQRRSPEDNTPKIHRSERLECKIKEEVRQVCKKLDEVAQKACKLLESDNPPI